METRGKNEETLNLPIGDHYTFSSRKKLNFPRARWSLAKILLKCFPSVRLDYLCKEFKKFGFTKNVLFPIHSLVNCISDSNIGLG